MRWQPPNRELLGDAVTPILDPADPETIPWSADALRHGAVLGVPTDTVYGLAAAIDCPAAIERVYAIKRRPATKPLPVLIARLSQMDRVALDVDDRLLALAAAFWPGPLTIVVPAASGLPVPVLGRDRRGRATVGVRLPAHATIRELIEQCGGLLAVTSANLSDQPPALTTADVVQFLGATIDAVIDGGPSPGGAASTVVTVDGNDPTRLVHLREGPLAPAAIARVWDQLAPADGAKIR